MKKVLLTSAGVILLALVTTIAVSGGANAGQKAHVTPAVVVTTSVQKQCHFPEDIDCPPTAEQAALLDVGHDLSAQQQKVVDDHWSNDANLTPEELALKKAIMAGTK